MHRYGTTPEQLGMIAVMQRQHALLTDNAQIRKPLTLDDYLPLLRGSSSRSACLIARSFPITVGRLS